MKTSIENFLKDKSNYYLGNDKQIKINEVGNLDLRDICLYHILTIVI